MTPTPPSAEDVVRRCRAETRKTSREISNDERSDLFSEVADFIETQRAEIERLRQPVDDEGLDALIQENIEVHIIMGDENASISTDKVIAAISPHIRATTAQARREALEEAVEQCRAEAKDWRGENPTPLAAFGASQCSDRIQRLIAKDPAK